MSIDKRKNNGGHSNGGRKSKAEEQQLIEKLSPMEEEVLKKFAFNIKAGEKWAIELFFKYMYGLPKQIIDANVTNTVIQPIFPDVQKDNSDK